MFFTEATPRRGARPKEGRSPHVPQIRREDSPSVTVTCTPLYYLKKPLIQNTQSIKLTIAAKGIIPLNIQSSPAGRLAHFITNWQKVTKDRWVLNTITGYEIEFISEPHQHQRPYPCQLNQSLVSQEITEMISKGAVSEILTPLALEGSFFSTLFLVPKKDGGQRPVINLKNLNSFINAPHFKMEGIHTFKSLLRKGDWLVKTDNPHKTTTQKVPVFPIRKRSLPVQLSPIRPGLQLSGDTVGGIHRRHSPNGGDQAEGQRPRVRPDTPSPMHNKPGDDNPTAITVPRIHRFHGGYHQNGAKSPNSKNEKIQAESRQLSGAEHVTCRTLSRLIGKMNATKVIPPAPLFYRSLQIDLASALREGNQDYETTLALSPDSKEELIWWDTQMINWNGKTLLTTEPDLIIKSDARLGCLSSGLQYRGSLVPPGERVSYKLSGTASGDSSPKDVCQEQDRSVSTNEDRQHDSSCLYQQSGRDNIQRADSPDPEPMDVVPGEEYPHPSTMNQVADMESRSMRDRSNWKLDRSVFLTIDKIYGPMEVDLFASRLTSAVTGGQIHSQKQQMPFSRTGQQ